MVRSEPLGGRRVVRRVLCGLVLSAAVLAAALPAGAEKLALLRIESLDALTRDVRTVAEASGQPFDAGIVETRVLGLLGLSDGDFVDRGRPVLVLLPLEGMMRKEKGLVGALPVLDPARAVEALAERFAGHQREGDVHTYLDPDGRPALYAKPQGRSVLLGASRDLVVGAGGDLSGAAVWDGPRGTVAVEVVLEPLMPLIEAGIMGAKDQFRRKVQQEAAAAPGVPFNPEALGGMVDLYIDTLRDLIVQVARVQAALGTEGDYLRFAKRLVPREGSTLAEFVGVQKGGWPDAARLIDGNGAIVTLSNARLTPAVRLALQDFLLRYLVAMDRLLTSPAPEGRAARPEGEAPTGAPDPHVVAFMRGLLSATGELLGRSVACVRGDFASSMSIAGEGGLTYLSAMGHTGQAGCGDLFRDGFKLLAEKVDGLPESERFFRFEETEVAATPTVRASMNVPALERLSGRADAGTEEWARKLYGGDEATFYATSVGDLYLQTGGPGAVAALQGALRRRRDPTAAGVGPELFAPLEAGPGSFALIRLGNLMEFGRTLSEEGSDTEAKSASPAFSGAAGRVPMGVTLDARGPTFEVAVPLGSLRAAAVLKGSGPEGSP